MYNNGNACKKIHNMLSDEMFTLSIEVSYATVPVCHLKKKRDVAMQWPVLKLSSWAKYELEKGGEMFLAGNNILDEAAWKPELKSFWDRYERVDESHPVFGLDPMARSTTIPYLLHGDEGRGRGRFQS